MKNTASKINNFSDKGFSLVELMVVVAIIGILASVAVPQFEKFQAKARQTEVKSLLASLYTAEQAFFVEWTGYAVNFNDIGFAPVGNIRYAAGFATGTTYCPVSYVAARGGSSGSVICPGTCQSAVANTKGLSSACSNTAEVCAPATATAYTDYACTIIPGSDGAYVTSATVDALAVVDTSTGNTFTAYAHGVIYKTFPDVWTINNEKKLVNITSGL